MASKAFLWCCCQTREKKLRGLLKIVILRHCREEICALIKNLTDVFKITIRGLFELNKKIVLMNLNENYSDFKKFMLVLQKN